MLNIHMVIGFDLFPDRGLRADYTGEDGNEYSLIFGILLSEYPSGMVPSGYGSPEIGLIRVEHSERRYDDLIPISWAEASCLLDEMRPFVNTSDKDQSARFEQMVYVATHSGKMPPDIKQNFGGDPSNLCPRS